jgi:hypothetical protein
MCSLIILMLVIFLPQVPVSLLGVALLLRRPRPQAQRCVQMNERNLDRRTV